MWFESFINLPIVLWKQPYETRTHGEKHQQPDWTDSSQISQEWRSPSHVLSDSTSQPCMGIMGGVTQLCWAWAVPMHNQIEIAGEGVLWLRSFMGLPIVLWKRPHETRTHGEKHQQILWTDSSQISQEQRTPLLCSFGQHVPALHGYHGRCHPAALGLGSACA